MLYINERFRINKLFLMMRINHKNKRGRPVGKTDSTQRTRRTAQEISDDKIRIAQMKLDALKETEERKLAAKKHELGLKRVKLLNQKLLYKKFQWQSLRLETILYRHRLNIM